MAEQAIRIYFDTPCRYTVNGKRGWRGTRVKVWGCDVMQWITDWSKIIMGENYIVCPIGLLAEGHTRLCQPIGRLPGWEVVRLIEGTYAALPVPPWDGSFKIPAG